MEPTHDDLPTARMWTIYACGWIAYLLLLGVALQLNGLREGRFEWHPIFQTIKSSSLQALFLALLWPLSGWLERRLWPAWAVCLLHLGSALAYGVLSYALMWLVFGFRQPLDWYLWPVLYAMMSYGVIAALFHMIRNNAARRRQAEAMRQAQALLVTAELNALRSKLNPHFLFNTLHSIIALTRKNPDAAETALFQFSDMLRYVLDTEKTDNDRVTLDDELGFVRDYLELESLRLGPRLNVDWQLDAAAGRHTLPALSLQPLVENSIKHAFNPHSRPGRLTIRTGIDARTHALTLTVRDDGPGADPEAVRASSGLGLRTVDRRLRLAYGAASGLTVDTRPGAGFTVTMSIPPESA